MITLVFDFNARMFWIWVIASVWLWWTSWFYWTNRDMPSPLGTLKYQNGENDFIRAVYAFVILAIYIALAWIWK
jgi:hypothetical protein